MQLNVTTDYAIRIVLCLASNTKPVSSTILFEKLGIPQSYVLKIAKKLEKAGLVKTHIGTYGGYSLAKSTSEINLFDVIDIMENTAKINRCMEDDHYCSRFAVETCPVRKFYCLLQEEIKEKLVSITIESLLEDCK
ncbi:RrF2 family transcriptional regulator [Amedibacillus sp. YH-ame6]